MTLKNRWFLAFLMVAALSGYSLLSLKRPDSAYHLILLGGGIFLDLWAVALPVWGYATAAAACYLALGYLSAPMVGLAAVSAILGAFARAALDGSGKPLKRCKEAAQETLPTLGALATLPISVLETEKPWLPFLVVTLTYLGLHRLMALQGSAEVGGDWLKFWDRLATARSLTVLLAIGLYGLAQQGWALLGGLAGAVGLQLLIREQVRSQRAPDAQALANQLESHQLDLARLKGQLDRTQTELGRKVEAYRNLEQLSGALTLVPNLERTLELVISMVEQQVECTSTVAFLVDGDRLVPSVHRTPNEKRLANAQLMGLVEPVAEEAWRTGSVASHRPEMESPQRLLTGEVTALAFPMGQLGVLYVGRLREGEFEDRERQVMTVVANQAALALISVQRNEAVRRAAQAEAQARRKLEDWAQGAQILLDCAGEMNSGLDQQQALQHLIAALRSLVPGSSHFVQGSQGLLFSSAEDCVPEAIAEVTAAVCRSGKPLLLDVVKDSRFQAPIPGHQSLLVAPLVNQEAVLGAVLLSQREAGAFTRKEQDLLSMLAFQAASVFQSIELHQQALDAYQQLQESEAQLVQSSKLAAVGQLAAGVAHELNTPLGTIRLAIDRALKAQLEPKVEKKLKRAQGEVVRACGITEKLLYYARDARSGRTTTQLESLLEDTLDLIGRELSHSKISVVKEFEKVPSVSCNQNEIQQVVINLLLNARDALASTSDPVIELRLKQDDEAVAIEVADNGAGISEEAMPRLFDPFFTTKPVGKGTGLGLSVSRSIAEEHQGTLVGKNAASGGAVFVLRLPNLKTQSAAGRPADG